MLICLIIAGLAALAAFAGALTGAIHLVQSGLLQSVEVLPLLALSAVTVAALFILAWGTFVIAAWLLVRTFLGRHRATWTAPQRCKDLATWLNSDWYVMGGSGAERKRHAGIRFMGFELAFTGTI